MVVRRQKTTIFGSAGFGSGFYGALLLLLLSFLSTFVTDIAKGSRVYILRHIESDKTEREFHVRDRNLRKDLKMVLFVINLEILSR